MSAVYLSENAFPALTAHLRAAGRRVVPVAAEPRLGRGVAAHADLRLCALGAGPRAPLFRAELSELGAEYPANARVCALVLGGFFIHRLGITLPRLLAAAKALGLAPVNVRQGYARCACVPLDGGAAVTSDPGVARALRALPGTAVLEIRPGFVALPGFAYGFLGGACGRVGDEVVFNGDLSAHPDGAAVVEFIRSRGLTPRYFPGLPLTDIGSVIESGD